ncbi:tetratricopeptide repeat protein [Pelagibacterium luteolum]|uniref:Tetratricopeptide repeat-containing protein n=1 Tax=Pelagibacterium luteolum TaxID=440168 RepID=A0A1G7TWG0_9HYPH|nr:tetratricopeptide repeat protein [Pelagibacterium luteolum]SDG39655.1 Tetratricopeptide repeat-containing protein [Pelagibacterium luteolum]
MQKLIVRPLTAMIVAALAMPLALPASAQTGLLPPRTQSVTGAYLAGIAALENLEANRAATYFREAAESDWDNPIYAGQTFLSYLLAGRISDAASMAQHVLDLNPQDELARLTLGAVALKERRYASAESTLARIPEASLVGVTAGIMRAWSKVGEGDLPAANQILNTVGQGGFEEFLVFHRAVMADLGGDRQSAITLAREAYEMDPFIPRIAEAYIRILGNAGQFEEAQSILDSFAEEGVVHPVVDSLRDDIANQTRPGLFADNVQAGAAEMLHGLGSALARDGSSELGVGFLRLAAYLDPQSAVISLSLGELLSTAGRYDDAETLFASVPSSSPLFVNSLIRLAENIDLKGDRDGAISRLENLLTTYPDNIEAYGILGDLLRYDEQWAEAAEAYSGIINSIETPRPRDWRFFYVRGISYERARMWDRAEEDFLRALELNPEHPDVLNYLGYTWVDRGENLNEALDMIERAVELSPRNGYIVDSLGWAFFKLGRIDEAVEQLETAVRILPADPEINDHLGDAYWMAGRQREAMFQWRIAIDVDEEGTVTERAAPKLIGGLDPDAPILD